MVNNSNTILYVVTEDWYFLSHRLPIARAARDAGFRVVVVTNSDRGGEKIVSEGFTLFNLDMARGVVRPIQEIKILCRLLRILRRERPAIVHNVAMKPVVYGTFASRLAGSRGIVNALAGLGYLFTSDEPKALILRRLVATVFRFLFRSPSVRVIVQNPDDRTTIESLGVPSKYIALIPGSGVDPAVFRPLPEVPGGVVVAMVSRMLWPKGVGEIVEASRMLIDKGRDIRIILVGAPDPLNPSSVDEGALMKWSREGLIEWTGSLPTSEIPTVWGQAHIAVLPSYYGEGIPKSLLEAAACGKPLIATDTPGCREVVIHGETGLLIPPRDSAALADAIGRLADDPELRSRLGLAARAHVEARFSSKLVVEKTLALYRSILSAT